MRLIGFFVIFFAICICESKSGFALESHPKNKPPDIAQPSENELFIMALTLGSNRLSDGLMTFFDGTELFLPLETLVRILEFPISVDPKAGTASGWLYSEDQVFSLDMRTGVATHAGRQLSYNRKTLQKHDDDIYVATSEVELWFQIRLRFDFRSQEIEIEPLRTLPFQERINRDKRHENAPDYRKNSISESYIEPQNDFLEWPFIDVSAYLNSRKTEYNSNSRLQQTTTVAGIIGDLDAEATVISRSGSGSPDVRARLGRRSLDNNLLGVLKAREYAIGDVATPSLSLISDNVVGRGAIVSNFDPDSLFETNQITLRGNLPLGWEVELYRNDELIGYQTSQDNGNGRYEFPEVPTVVGVNLFRLSFYGPQGQKREQEERYYITPGLNKPGQTYYLFAANQADTDLISLEPKEYSAIDVGTERFIFQLDHGLTETVSVRGGLASLSLDGERHNYLSGGLRSSLFGSLVSLDLGIDQAGGFAIGGSLKTQLDSWSLTAEQSWFQNFASEKSEDLAINGEEISSLSLLRLNGQLPDFGIFGRNLVSATIKHRIAEKGAWQTNLFGRISQFNGPFNISLATDTQFGSEQDLRSDLLLIGSIGGAVRWRGEISIDPFDSLSLNSSSISANWNFNEVSGASAGLRYSNTSDDLASMSVGLYRNFKALNLGFNINADTNSNYSVSLGLSFSLGHNPLNNNFEMRGGQHARQSAISAQVFLDKNNDGVFNSGDKPIKNARFSGGAIPQSVTTTDEGIAFYPGIRPYKRVKIALDESSLEEPQWSSVEPPKLLSLRPGLTTMLTFPVVETGDMDGWVFYESKTGIPASGLKVQVVNEKGEKIAETVSAYDGYYFIQGLPFGKYQVRLDPDQLDSIQYYSEAPRPFRIDENDPFVLDRYLIIFPKHISETVLKTEMKR